MVNQVDLMFWHFLAHFNLGIFSSIGPAVNGRLFLLFIFAASSSTISFEGIQI